MTNTICEWFSSFTTIGGLGQTLTSAEKYWKFAWATLTCVALYFTFIGAKQTIDEFRDIFFSSNCYYEMFHLGYNSELYDNHF